MGEKIKNGNLRVREVGMPDIHHQHHPRLRRGVIACFMDEGVVEYDTLPLLQEHFFTANHQIGRRLIFRSTF